MLSDTMGTFNTTHTNNRSFIKALSLTLVITWSGDLFACPGFDPYSLWLAKDKEQAKEKFLSKAKTLHDSGQCVIEGGYGRSYEKFYITVSKTGKIRDAKILRFTYDELSEN